MDCGIRDVEIDGFGIAVTLDIEGAILRGDCLTCVHHTAQEWLEIVPKLGPILARGSAKSYRVPMSDGRSVRLIVERDQIWSPEHDDLGLGRQHDIDSGLQTARPC
ncbi:hypothetical protein D3C73_1364620 [compost metagenome]